MAAPVCNTAAVCLCFDWRHNYKNVIWGWCYRTPTGTKY